MKTFFQAAILVSLACPSAAQGQFAGEWMLTLQPQFGAASISRLSLVVSNARVTGSLGDQRIEGTVLGPNLEFKSEDGAFKLAVQGDALAGEAMFPDSTARVIAVRIPPRPANPRTHDFDPTEFHLYFSSRIKPALQIQLGDTVRTWAVDTGGRDKEVTRRSGGDNPQTGPFFVEGVVPGDTLIIHINKVSAQSRLGAQRQQHHAARAGASGLGHDGVGL